MIKIQKLTFNPFQENTYVLSDETKDCIIIDPGCFGSHEEGVLKSYIETEGLNPVKLVATHCHIDHVLGNDYVVNTYDLDFYAHKQSVTQLELVPISAQMFGLQGYKASPGPTHFLKEGDSLTFGHSALEVMYCPGHAPDHLVFYSAEQGFVINGDVLFQGSFGRVDLPGGDFATLKASILNKMFALPDDTVVYTGHGGETTIGREKLTNPIINANW